jgi:hypothetical protein
MREFQRPPGARLDRSLPLGRAFFNVLIAKQTTGCASARVADPRKKTALASWIGRNEFLTLGR